LPIASAIRFSARAGSGENTIVKMVTPIIIAVPKNLLAIFSSTKSALARNPLILSERKSPKAACRQYDAAHIESYNLGRVGSIIIALLRPVIAKMFQNRFSPRQTG
jgi:hypothetical protein